MGSAIQIQFRRLIGTDMKRTLTLLTLCSFETMLVIVFATCAALAQETAPSYAIASPPACQNNLGEPVRFENQMSPKAKSAAGMARRDDKGVPVIYRFAYANHGNHYKTLLITMNARIIKPAILIVRIRQEIVLIT